MDRIGSERPEVAAGKTLMFWISAVTALAAVFSHAANFAACAACLELAVTVVAEPPQMPVVWSPAVHAGSGATAHLPLVLGGDAAELGRAPTRRRSR